LPGIQNYFTTFRVNTYPMKLRGCLHTFAIATVLLPFTGFSEDELHVFQGKNPILFKDLSDPTVHGYKPEKYVESYEILYGDEAEAKIAAMKERRRKILGRKPVLEERDVSKVPAHLKGYEPLYRKDPRAAAREWFSDAKYGLFMHWGVYALDGIGVRYQMGRALKPYWDFDPIPVKEYEQLMHHWHVEHFDADFICDMAVRAGMKYVVITVKHSDGFHLWDSACDHFNSMNAASRRDITFELARACRERGLGFIPFYEIGYECRHPHGVEQGRVPYERYTGKKEPYYAYGDDLDPTKYADDVRKAVKKLVKYDIAGVWFDGYGITKTRQVLFRLQELYDIVHEAIPYALVVNKPGPTGTEDYFDTEGFFYAPGIDPNYDRNAAQGKRLEVCKSMAGGWGWHAERHFLPHEKHAWPAERLWKELMMFNTFGANLLLNLGPRWDGSIEPSQVEVLAEIGDRIRKEGYPEAKGAERDALAAEVQRKIDAKLIRKLRGRDWGKQKAVVKRLQMQPKSDEYKTAMKEMRRLTDLADPENQKLLDQWYEGHPADWFIRGKQFLKPAAENPEPVKVTVRADTEKWTISNYLTGLHFVYAWEKDAAYDDGKVADWARKHHVNTARYPGGQASHWYWKDPSGKMGISALAADFNGKRADEENWMNIDEYLDFCRRAEMTPLIGVNFANVTVDRVPVELSVRRAAEQVEHVKRRGFEGAFWYIGNEDLWEAGGRGPGAPERAAKLFVEHAKAMKAVDPKIKIFWNHNRVTPAFLKSYMGMVGRWADGVEFHGKWPYGGKQHDYVAATFEEWKKEVPLTDRKSRTANWRERIKALRQATVEMGRPELLLANNEYGLNGNRRVLEGFNRYTKSLVVVDFLQELFVSGYDMACFWANISGGDHKLMDSRENYRMNPMHIGFELLGMAQRATMVESESSNTYVYGFAAKTADNVQLYLLNKTEEVQPTEIKFTGMQPNIKRSPNAIRMVDTPDHWGRKEAFDVVLDSDATVFRCELKPLTYARIVFER